jgi:hypothetical protein
MATTLTSSITHLDTVRLKTELEALSNVRVVSITPPIVSGGITTSPTTVVLTQSDRYSNLTGPQAAQAQAVIDGHVDLQDESADSIATDKVTIGTLIPGLIEFVNDGLAWKIDPTKAFLPVGPRNIGSLASPVETLYVNTIVGASVVTDPGSAANSIFNEIPAGLIDGVNSSFTTQLNFSSGSTRVFVNGLRQSLGGVRDYTETSANTITFNTPPLPNDAILIDYNKAI